MSLINEPRETLLGPPLAMPVPADAAPTPDDVVAFADEHRWRSSTSSSPTCRAPGSTSRSPRASSSEGLLTEGAGFDGSSIRGFQEINESDMLLVPDPGDGAHRPVP